MEMKSRVAQLCISISTWSMVAILGLGCIQVKGEYIVKADEALEIKEQTCTRSCTQCKSTYTLYSQLMIRLVDLYN